MGFEWHVGYADGSQTYKRVAVVLVLIFLRMRKGRTFGDRGIIDGDIMRRYRQNSGCAWILKLYVFCISYHVTGGGKRSSRQKTTTCPQITDNFLTCLGRDSNPGINERQLTFSGNASDRTTIGAGPIPYVSLRWSGAVLILSYSLNLWFHPILINVRFFEETLRNH